MMPAARRPDRPARCVTENQRRTLGAIACLTLLHGRSPTLSELGRVLRVTKQAADYRLHWLAKKGLWSRTQRVITQAGLRCARGWLVAGARRSLMPVRPGASAPPASPTP